MREEALSRQEPRPRCSHARGPVMARSMWSLTLMAGERAEVRIAGPRAASRLDRHLEEGAGEPSMSVQGRRICVSLQCPPEGTHSREGAPRAGEREGSPGQPAP